MTLAFVFPGQGSQSIGMQQELAERWPLVRETYDEGSAALGHDLWALTRNGPAERLDSTEFTQPALLCAGVAAWRVWCSLSDRRPGVMAGHSLGEYTALVCSGALGFADGVTLVNARGRFMQAAVPPGSGSMAVVLGLDDAAVRGVCADAADGDVVQAVNFNAPGQVAIAGSAAAVARATELARERGARRAMALAVSVPSHCDLMKPAAAELAERLATVELRPPTIPVVNNVDVARAATPDEIRDALVRQLHSPVRWVETVSQLVADGASRIVECGPGKVLAGLARRIDRSIESVALETPENFEALVAALDDEEGQAQ